MSVQPQVYFETRISDGQYFVVNGLIHKRDDLGMVRMPDPDDESIYEPARRFLEKYRPYGYAIGCFINLGSDPVVLSMGWDHFSYALYDDPTLIDSLFDLYGDWYARAVRHLCKLGFDFIWAGDDIAFRSGLMISPRMFRKHFMPCYRRVAENITIPWIFHTDGNFLAVFEDLLSLGMDALHPIEPDAVDILEVKRRAAGRVGLVGNIDINLLSTGSAQEVERVTRETIRQVAPGDRFILSSSNSITRSCRIENVQAMVGACRRYGQYPVGSESRE
jgi:uroporphyrinogen decarboxylase